MEGINTCGRWVIARLSLFLSDDLNFEFKEDRKVPIIQNTEEYDMAVESAMFDLKTLPIFIPTIKYNTNPTELQKTETIYEITLEFNGMAATVPVYFTPQDETISLPSFVDGMPNYKSGYYNMYNYEFFFTSVNEDIRTAMLNLIEKSQIRMGELYQQHFQIYLILADCMRFHILFLIKNQVYFY